MRPPRPLIVAAVFALVAAACNGEDPELGAPTPDGGPPAEEAPAELDFVAGRLHDCAEGMPVPDELSIMESGLAPSEMDFDSCLTTMRGEISVEDASDAYRAELDDAGWEHALEQEDDFGRIVRFTDPACGFLTVITGPTAAEFGLVTPEEGQGIPSIVLAQIVPCEAMPPPTE